MTTTGPTSSTATGPATRPATRYDDHYHGTHVAGTIGAIGDNSVGVAGVSWNVQIMAIKFLDSGGSGYTSDAIDGLNYAVSMGAMISNNSWGGGPYDQGLYDAIQSAGVQGHVFVAAAGNNGQNADVDPMYPAAYDLDNIVSVAATDHNDQLAGFSNYGATSVDLAAPGVSVYSTLPGNCPTAHSQRHVHGHAARRRRGGPDPRPAPGLVRSTGQGAAACDGGSDRERGRHHGHRVAGSTPPRQSPARRRPTPPARASRPKAPPASSPCR